MDEADDDLIICEDNSCNLLVPFEMHADQKNT